MNTTVRVILHLELLLLLTMAVTACNITSDAYNSIAGQQLLIQTANTIPESLSPEIRKTMHQLISPKFFDIPQAARFLVAMGEKAIPILYKCRHLVRESNATVVPVCLLIIEIIFQQQKKEWILAKLNNKYKEIRQIAAGELKKTRKRKKSFSREQAIARSASFSVTSGFFACHSRLYPVD